MVLVDCLTVFLISIGSGLLSEGLSWMLIYRTEQYQRHKDIIERVNAQLDALKAKTATIDAKASLDKKVNAKKAQLKSAQQSMAGVKMKSMVFHIVVLVAVLNVLSSMYDGLIVAELPFTPWGFFQSMTKRYLPPDTRDTACSMMFIYVVTSFGVRPSLQKALGTAQPKGSAPSMFDIPEQEQMRR